MNDTPNTFEPAGDQEQEARQDFIDKFWAALSWDGTHTTQTNPNP